MAYNRRSTRSPRSRTTLALLVLTAVTILVLDLPGTGPLDPVRNVLSTAFSPIRAAGNAIFEPLSNGWKGAFGYDDVKADRTVKRELEDVYEGEKRSILLRLEIDASATGTLDLGKLTLNYRTARSGERHEIARDISVSVSSDAKSVESSRNRESSAEAELAGHVLTDADEAQPRVAQRHTVVGVPAAQEAAAHLDRHAADRGAVVHPARVAEPHPGLAVALLHVFDGHAADVVRQHVIAGAGHRMRQAVQPELAEAGQELLFVLAPKQPEHPVAAGLRPGARGHHQLQAQQQLMVQFGLQCDGAGRGVGAHGAHLVTARPWLR